MEERLRNHYFLAVRIGLLFVLIINIVLSHSVLTGASYKVLLFLALFVGAVVGKELVEGWKRNVFIVISVMLFGFMLYILGTAFLPLGIFLCYEILSNFRPRMMWYFCPIGIAFIQMDHLMTAMFLCIIYIQHDFVVESYRKQMKEDMIEEQSLKHHMYYKEYEMQEEVRRSLLMAENRMLEERTQLFQILHDRLGHNINGSVYQLEAVKVLMEKEPEASKKMLQAVIDQLRMGMDEIRAILRRERPKKYKLAIVQIEELCEDCRSKGVEAKLITEGELSRMPEKYLEIILDNAYEAVSNSMKYAQCTKIEIRIHVLNQVIRCSISDNGIGCETIVDGMGISGMRKRVREVNGILNFESENGFTINMLLPKGQDEIYGKD